MTRLDDRRIEVSFPACMIVVCVTNNTGKVGTFKRYQWTRVPLRPISHKKKRSCFQTCKPIGWRRIAVLPFPLNFTTTKIKNCLFANKSTSHRESKCEVVLAELYWRWLSERHSERNLVNSFITVQKKFHSLSYTVFASARTGGHRSAKRKACSSETANKGRKVHGRQNFVQFCKK